LSEVRKEKKSEKAQGRLEYRRDYSSPESPLLGASSSSSQAIYVQDSTIAEAFLQAIDPGAADLLDVAAAVYHADRMSKRGDLNSSWLRYMTLRVPVRQPKRWRAWREKIESAIGYLTGDVWSFEFVQRGVRARSSEADGFLFADRMREGSQALLYSGGLDSVAGVLASSSHQSGEVCPITVLTSSRLKGVQQQTLAEVERSLGNRLRPISVRVELQNRAERAFDQEERSQRARALLFQAIGAVAASTGGLTQLAIVENGIGAINLPYVPWQVSAQAGRAANPIWLRRFREIAREFVCSSFEVLLPSLSQTKAQLLHANRSGAMERLVPLTVSCDRFPQRVAGRPQCGVCTSCLLRRQSLLLSGLSEFDDHDSYRYDVYRASNGIPHQLTAHLFAMDTQAQRIASSLTGADRLRRLELEFPSLAEVVETGAAEEFGVSDSEIVCLYETYVEEWMVFRNNVPLLKESVTQRLEST
jgi:7-cyano-7-deazaguanine synthase in queuosine biosynthesis